MARKTLTAADRRRILELVAAGKSRPAAARELGTTGSAIRALLKRDPAFADAYTEAAEEGGYVRDACIRESLYALAERTDIQIDELAIGDRIDPAGVKALLAIAEARLPEFEYRRKRRLEHTTPDGKPFPLQIDVSKLSDDELDLMETLLEQARPD